MGNAFDDGVAASGTDLTTLNEIKDYLDITRSDDTWDTVLGALQDVAEKRIQQYCREEFTAQAYTEYHDGRGLSKIVLLHRPVNSITSIHDDLDREYGDNELVDSDDYTFYPNTGIVVKDGGTFQDGTRNVKVIYNAGYTTIPADVEGAVWQLVAYYWNEMRAGADGIDNERIGDYTAKYEKMTMPQNVRALLMRYRSVQL